MRQRCRNQKNPAYKDYGGRGISICERWDDFSLFEQDMGSRPDGASLDRIDNDGDYTPTNCRWATNREQSRNTRRNVHVELDGKRRLLSDLAAECGLDYMTLRRRVFDYGWTIEKAMSTRPHAERTNRIKFSDDDVIEMRQLAEDGMSLSEISKKFGIDSGHLSRIVRYEARANVFPRPMSLRLRSTQHTRPHRKSIAGDTDR